MDLSVLLVFSLIFALTLSNKQYRSDYVYNAETDAFYKLHIEYETFWQASAKCSNEGAKLMASTDHQDLVQFHGMFKRFPDAGKFAWVDNDNIKHESAEVQPIIDLSKQNEALSSYANTKCTVVTRDGELQAAKGCYFPLPFICKVTSNDAFYDDQCKVYAKNYQYVSSVGSCYKVSTTAGTWNEAVSECEIEGSHLVILNSESEREVVQGILRNATRVVGAKADWFFFAGIRANKPKNDTERVFKTILNETLDKAGFNEWSDHEPNNYLDSEYCGSIFKTDGKYNDIDCRDILAYVCEKEVE